MNEGLLRVGRGGVLRFHMGVLKAYTKKPQIFRAGAFFISGAPASFELDSKKPVFIGCAWCCFG